MHVNEAVLLYFSPTGTTRRVLEGLAAGLGVETVTHADLTLPGAVEDVPVIGEDVPVIGEDALVLVGVPVYGGRVPAVAAERLRRVRGQGALAVLVVVYGNRLFEDALLELRDLAKGQGFRPVAGAAFIAEHSFSTVSLPLSAGRPDDADLRTANAYGRQIREKLDGFADVASLPELDVPGNFPYRDWHMSTDTAPVTDAQTCTRCGACVGVCPTEAIDPDDVLWTDPVACILCCACVRACPTGARVLDAPGIQRTRVWLSEACSEPKSPELWS